MKNQIQKAIQNSISVKQQILQDAELLDRVALTVSQMVKTLKNGGKIHFCGNGGSAADAQHLAAELSGRFYFDREPLNAEALHCNTSYLTAVANDYGYDEVYARLLKGTAHNGSYTILYKNYAKEELWRIKNVGNCQNGKLL